MHHGMASKQKMMKSNLPFQFQSVVIHGEELGRTIGFPTANFADLPNENELALGVHFGECEIDPQTPQSKTFFCISYFGPRFVVGQVKNVFEVYLYDFEGEIYGKKVKVTLSDFIREPIKLSTLEKLKKQLEKDKEEGKQILRWRRYN